MEGASNRPRVFVSSTIVDFRDLRSALRYWLESFGLDVRMSEFHDFTRRPEQGTFDSCFDVIPQCDYFILLVGGRKGSEYVDGESVTQHEYRIAVKLAEQGKIIPIVFIRKEVQTVLRDRKKVKTAIGLVEVENVQTSVLEHPEFVRAFVNQIETTEVGRRGEDPSGNMWIYPFDSFREITDALRNNLRLFGSIPRQTLLANLDWELKANIAALCGKEDEGPLCGHWWLRPLRPQLSLTADDMRNVVRLNLDQAAPMVHFLVIGAPTEQSILSAALRDAISSREFLVYQPHSGQLVPSPELNAMYALDSAIEHYRSLRTHLRVRQDALLAEAESAKNQMRPARIMGQDLLLTLALGDLMINILRLSFAMLDYISDPSQGIKMPELVDLAISGEKSNVIREEQATHADIEHWRVDHELRSRILS